VFRLPVNVLRLQSKEFAEIINLLHLIQPIPLGFPDDGKAEESHHEYLDDGGIILPPVLRKQGFWLISSIWG
jgi:hypothetical protein